MPLSQSQNFSMIRSYGISMSRTLFYSNVNTNNPKLCIKLQTIKKSFMIKCTMEVFGVLCTLLLFAQIVWSITLALPARCENERMYDRVYCVLILFIAYFSRFSNFWILPSAKSSGIMFERKLEKLEKDSPYFLVTGWKQIYMKYDGSLS